MYLGLYIMYIHYTVCVSQRRGKHPSVSNPAWAHLCKCTLLCRCLALKIRGGRYIVCMCKSIRCAHVCLHYVTVVCFFMYRSHSHSSDSSFEDDFGVRKEVLLHGTYDDYIKEYKSRSGGVSGGSSSKGQPSMADVAAAYQKALTQVASALQHQGSSSKVGTIKCMCAYLCKAF